MKPTNRDLTGQRFGRLTVLEKVVHRGVYTWRCQCDCGEYSNVSEKNLISSHTKSCGCLRRTNNSAITHGRSHEPEYASWRMINRQALGLMGDRRPIHPVDPNWVNSYAAFYEDMGPKPSRHHHLTRRDRSLGFNKENCYWRPL